MPVDRRDDRTARHAGAILQLDDDLRFDHDGPDRIVGIVGAGALIWRAGLNPLRVELADGSGEWIGDDEATGPDQGHDAAIGDYSGAAPGRRGVVGTVSAERVYVGAVLNNARFFGAVAKFRTIEEKQEFDRLDVACLADSDTKGFADVILSRSAAAHAKSGGLIERLHRENASVRNRGERYALHRAAHLPDTIVRIEGGYVDRDGLLGARRSLQ